MEYISKKVAAYGQFVLVSSVYLVPFGRCEAIITQKDAILMHLTPLLKYVRGRTSVFFSFMPSQQQV